MKRAFLQHLAIVLIAAFLSASPLAAQMSDVERAIAAGDHAAAAKYYRAQAEDLKKISEQHARMRDLYQKNHDHYRDFEKIMAHHCDNLRLQLLQSSYVYEALAKEEEKLEKKSR